MYSHLPLGKIERRLHVALMLSDPSDLLRPSKSGLFLAEVVPGCIVFRLTCLHLDLYQLLAGMKLCQGVHKHVSLTIARTMSNQQAVRLVRAQNQPSEMCVHAWLQHCCLG